MFYHWYSNFNLITNYKCYSKPNSTHRYLLRHDMTEVMVQFLHSPDWLVYSLSSAGDGGDGNTWMSLWLNDTLLGPKTPSSLASFTVCVWFKVTTFLDFATLLSYSVASDQLSHGIKFREYHTFFTTLTAWSKNISFLNSNNCTFIMINSMYFSKIFAQN